MYGGYNTMGQEFGIDHFEVGDTPEFGSLVTHSVPSCGCTVCQPNDNFQTATVVKFEYSKQSRM